MNAKIAKRLRRIAKELQPITELQPISIWGSEILKVNPNARDGQGKPIKKRTRYISQKYVPVNHEDRVKKAYVSGGDKAVSEYSGKVERRWNEMQQQQRALDKKLPVADEQPVPDDCVI